MHARVRFHLFCRPFSDCSPWTSMRTIHGQKRCPSQPIILSRFGPGFTLLSKPCLSTSILDPCSPRLCFLSRPGVRLRSMGVDSRHHNHRVERRRHDSCGGADRLDRASPVSEASDNNNSKANVPSGSPQDIRGT